MKLTSLNITIMKNSKFTSQLLLLTALVSFMNTLLCCRQNESDKNNLLMKGVLEENGSYNNMRLEMISSLNGEVLLVANGKKADDPTSTDKAFILQTDGKSKLPSRTKANGFIEYKSSILVLSSENELLYFSVDRPDGRKLYDSLSKTIKDKKIVGYFGYGFVKYNGNFTVDFNKSKPSAYDYLTNESATTNKKLLSANLEPIESTDCDDCDSGGTGSNACSIDGGGVLVSPKNCSVSCSAGYYSCCISAMTKVKCGCCRNK